MCMDLGARGRKQPPGISAIGSRHYCARQAAKITRRCPSACRSNYRRTIAPAAGELFPPRTCKGEKEGKKQLRGEKLYSGT